MEYKQLLELIESFNSSKMTHLELEMDDLKLKLNKEERLMKEVAEVVVNQAAVESLRAEKVQAAPVQETTGQEVRSPLVGTYYEAPSPTEAPFVKVGQKVSKGDTICIIEAMKIMNEITAPCDGVVESVNAKNGDVVSYDQVLITIR